MPMFNYLRDKALKHVTNESLWAAPPATVYLALMSTANSQGALGTELTGNGYARKAITWAALASHQKKNSIAIDFDTVITAQWVWRYWAILDVSSGGTADANGFWYNDRGSNQTVPVGNHVQIATSDLVIEFT